MKRRIFAAAFVAAAVCLIIIGIVLGDNHVVLTKAVNICLECIGIG